MKREYNGKLGKFIYEDTQFELYKFSSFERLKYIGGETNGKFITIPKGLINCESMFENTNITYPPEIPDSVVIGYSMFARCANLLSVPRLPSSMTDCSYMFMECKSLRSVPELPNTITICKYMFSGCSGISLAKNIPKNMIDGNAMFLYCRKDLKVTREITLSKKCKCTYQMFDRNTPATHYFTNIKPLSLINYSKYPLENLFKKYLSNDIKFLRLI